MESRSLTLDDLTNLFDDCEPVAHDDAPENTGVPTLAPLPAGKYGLNLLSIDVDRDQTGQVRNKNKFVCDFKVVDPPKESPWAEGRVIKFIRLSGVSKKRKGKDGVERAYVELFDVVHAFEKGFNCQNSLGVANRFLLEKIADQSVCYLQLDWKAWDTKHANSSNFDQTAQGSAERKQLYKEIDIRGHAKFGSDGLLINPPSGNLLKAQLYMRWAYEG